MIDALLPAALNHLLAGADWARARLAPFAGRDLKLHAPPLNLVLAIDRDGYFVSSVASEPEITLTLPGLTLSNGLQALQDIESVLREARIEGKADFAQELGFVLRNLRWDYEEDLSRVVGDIAAHRIAGGLRGLFRWQQQAQRNFRENLVEYLAEEQEFLLKPAEAKQFQAAVHALNEKLDALEARLRTFE